MQANDRILAFMDEMEKIAWDDGPEDLQQKLRMAEAFRKKHGIKAPPPLSKKAGILGDIRDTAVGTVGDAAHFARNLPTHLNQSIYSTGMALRDTVRDPLDVLNRGMQRRKQFGFIHPAMLPGADTYRPIAALAKPVGYALAAKHLYNTGKGVLGEDPYGGSSRLSRALTFGGGLAGSVMGLPYGNFAAPAALGYAGSYLGSKAGRAIDKLTNYRPPVHPDAQPMVQAP